MRNILRFLLAASTAVVSLALPVHEPKAVAERAISELPRLVIYFQTTHDASGNPISMLPLITEKNIALTHLIVCSFHISVNSVIHLNDFPPDDPHFDTLWEEAAVVQDAGVRVMGMIGGAASGSFTTETLDSTNTTTFEFYYAQLHDMIQNHSLQGMDLDVEQSMSQTGITRLVDRLYADFGAGFEITLAPVASALEGEGNLSGFNYTALEDEAGSEIAFYNGQFYNGFGSMSNPIAFEDVVANGWNPEKVVVGQITSSANGGDFVPFDVLNTTIQALRAEFGEIGGIMGWEYFNSQPGGTAEPWVWAQEMTSILRPDSVVELQVSEETADKLEAAWRSSVAANTVASTNVTSTNVASTNLKIEAVKSTMPDYRSMVNV